MGLETDLAISGHPLEVKLVDLSLLKVHYQLPEIGGKGNRAAFGGDDDVFTGSHSIGSSKLESGIGVIEKGDPLKIVRLFESLPDQDAVAGDIL